MTFPEALSYDDVLLLPGPSSVLPRDVDVTARLHDTVRLEIPILSAAMDRVTEAELGTIDSDPEFALQEDPDR